MLVLPESSKRLLIAASASYEKQLQGSVAEEYLIQERGLSLEVLRSFQIGFCGNPEPGDDMYRGMISIPFVTVSGVVAIQFRQPQVVPKGSKRFLNRGSTKRLYNPTVLLEPHRTVYVCEGPIDTMTVAELELPAIGIPGVENWLPLFARALRNRRVVVLADGDDDGQGKNFAARISTDVDESATVLFEGMDVNKYATEYGLDALREKIEID